MFTEGFEKEAGPNRFKSLAVAGMMALAPGKAKAGMTSDALGALGSAAQKTQVGQTVSANAQKYLDQAQNFKLWGRGGGSAGGTATQAAEAVGTAATKSPNLYLKNGNQLQLDYGRMSASLGPGSARANYNLGRGMGAELSSGRENRAGFSFKKEF